LVADAAKTPYSKSSSATTMRERIPFAFHAGSKERPAGEYNLRVLNPSSDRKALQIRSVDGRVSASVRAFDVNASAAEKSKLVFHRYGDTYFFAQAQVAGELTTLAAIKSGAERSQERMLARNNKQKLNVAIAAE
jgi:hypothetical protein